MEIVCSMWSLVSFFSTFIKSFMKLGLSIVSFSLRSSFLSFHVLHLDIHSNGVTGVHFRHCSSKAISIFAKSLYFSVLSWLDRVSCAFIFLGHRSACVLTGEGRIGGELELQQPVLTYVITV